MEVCHLKSNYGIHPESVDYCKFEGWALGAIWHSHTHTKPAQGHKQQTITSWSAVNVGHDVILWPAVRCDQRRGRKEQANRFVKVTTTMITRICGF